MGSVGPDLEVLIGSPEAREDREQYLARLIKIYKVLHFQLFIRDFFLHVFPLLFPLILLISDFSECKVITAKIQLAVRVHLDSVPRPVSPSHQLPHILDKCR